MNKEPTYVLDEMIDTILVAKTMEPNVVGKGSLHYTDSRADTWVITDWYTGDYVFSKTGSTFFDTYLVPGVYMVRVYGPGMEYLGFYKELMDGNVVKEFSWTSGSKTYTEKWDADYGDYRRSAVSDDLRAPATDHDRIKFVRHAQNSVKTWANHLKTLSSGMTPLQRADFVLDFVQQCIVYESDKDYCGGEDYWKCPYETLFDGRGDCEDSAILYCALMKSMGYDTALLLFVGEEYVDAGHAAASVALENVPGGTYYENGGKKYYYCETTNDDFEVGESPEGYDSAEMLIVR